MKQVERDITDVRSPLVVERVSRPPHLKALTSIRFFAAIYVATFHLVQPQSLWGRFSGFVVAGHCAVSFFFLLSGFILTYVHSNEYERGKDSLSRFWMARFARIYPVYLLTMIVAGYVSRSSFSNRVHILAYLADLLMVQSWSERVVGFFNLPAWSLSNEAFFYLLFPFLILKLRPSSFRKGLWSVLVFWIIGMIPGICMVWLYPHASGTWYERTVIDGNAWVYRVRYMPIFMLPTFLAGIPLAWMHLKHPFGKRASLALTCVGGVGILLVLANGSHLPYLPLHNGLLIPFFAMVIIGLSHDHAISRALSIAPLVLLGEASYSLYLTHFVVNDWLTHAWGLKSDIQSFYVKLLVLIPLSIALYLGVERPGRKWILTRWNQSRKTVAA